MHSRLDSGNTKDLPITMAEKTYFFSTGFYPCLCIGISNATSNLEMSRPGCESLSRSFLIVGPQHDDMGTQQVGVAIELRKVSRWVFGDIVRFEFGFLGTQGATDYLLHLAGVQVDARTKAGHVFV